MRLIESIACEFQNILVNTLSKVFSDSILFCALIEERLVLFLLIDILFGDGSSEQISITRRERSYCHHCTPNLFLIDPDSIGIPQNRFQKRRLILNFLPPFFSLCKRRNIIPRSWTIKSKKTCNILKRIRMDFLNRLTEAKGVIQLENPCKMK